VRLALMIVVQNDGVFVDVMLLKYLWVCLEKTEENNGRFLDRDVNRDQRNRKQYGTLSNMK